MEGQTQRLLSSCRLPNLQFTMLLKDLRGLVHLKTVLGMEDHAKKMINAVHERVRRNPKRSARQMTKEWVWTQWKESSKIISSCFLTTWEGDNTSHMYKNKIKKLDRTNILLRDLKARMAESEIFFFWWKNCHDWSFY